MGTDGLGMEVHEGFGKQVPALAEATGSNRNSNIQECYRVCFQSTSNSLGEEISSGTLIKKKDNPDDEVIYFSQAKIEGWLVQIGFFLLCHHQKSGEKKGKG